jgi:hypothetical protein
MCRNHDGDLGRAVDKQYTLASDSVSPWYLRHVPLASLLDLESQHSMLLNSDCKCAGLVPVLPVGSA